MARKAPRVKKHWHLLVQMQQHIDGRTTPNAAAVKVATKHWHGVSSSYDACVAWVKDNQRKHRADLQNEVDPLAEVWAEQREQERERLSKLTPKERQRYERRKKQMEKEAREYNEQRKKEMEEKRASVTKYEKAKARAARLEAARQEEVETAHFHEWFKVAPKEAIGVLVDEMLREFKRELLAEFELKEKTTGG